MSSFYSVGLQNVGSYQVAGRPWLKDLSLGSGDKVLLEFPNVTREIHISNDHASGGSSHILEVMFCEPRRAIDFTGNTEFLTSTFSAIDQITVSAWIKLDTPIVNLRLLEVTGGNPLRAQTYGAGPFLRLHVDGSNVNDNTIALVSGEWINLTLVGNGTANKLFVNGQLLLTNSNDSGSGFTGLDIGGSGTSGYDGIYDELVVFSTALEDAEVRELYNAGASMKIENHSRASSLVSHWNFEDNNYKNFYTTPDTTNLIYDRISGNNLSLTNGVTPLTFVDGRLIENAEARHKIQLVGEEQITMECKVRQVFLSCPNNATLASICASLTGIPANRMFELTGPGIDE